MSDLPIYLLSYSNPFRLLLDWSEVWATFMPITGYFIFRRQPHYMKPVITYFFFALAINLAGNIIADFKRYLPYWLQSNNPLYNIHSLVRFICYSIFFTGLGQQAFRKISYALPVISLIILIINFSVVENFFNPEHLSGNLLAAEAYLLLIYCMLYYLAKLSDEQDNFLKEPDFWVVTGLSIYVTANFFVFLFYVPMIYQDGKLANSMWDVHNVSYIILCILTTKALYDSSRYQYTS